MNRDEFLALPPAVAIQILYDASPKLGDVISAVAPPRSPRPPKFDQRLRKKDGFQWASETALSDLRWFHGRCLSGGNEKYAEKNAKEAKAIAFWIEWRRWEPSAQWTGERNHAQVMAMPPSSSPAVHQFEPRSNGGRQEQAPAHEPDFDAPDSHEERSFDEDSSDIPF